MLAERIEKWFDEATRKGILQGRAEGWTEGQLQLLSRLLERRFGPLPPAVRERLAHASLAALEGWGETVLTAASLESVFGTLRH